MFETVIEEFRRAAYAEGFEEGLRRARLINLAEHHRTVALKLVQRGYAVDLIGEVLGRSVAEVEEFIAQATTALSNGDDTPG